MSYTINKFSGPQLVVLEDGTIDTSTSIGLVGRNYVGYGETQNENFVFLLENFANDAAPSRPIQGQTWFNSTNSLLYVYNGTAWAIVGSATLSSSAPVEPSNGALWLDSDLGTLNIWNGDSWDFIGPEVAEGFGVTRARSTTLLGTDNARYPVIVLTINDVITAICSSSAFTIALSETVEGFLDIVAGITMSSLRIFKGDIAGNATSATRLETLRTINGIGFNGTTDITVQATTTNPLIRGDYLTGSNFNGSAPVTWSVDASSANVIGKVVVRNSQGGFAAGTITADLVGNVTGNVNATTGTSVFNTIQATEVIGPVLRGNSSSATRLQTGRTINGTYFDGSADVTVTAAAGTLTGTTLSGSVVTSSLTSVGTLTSLKTASTGVEVDGSIKMFTDTNGIPTIRGLSSNKQIKFDIVDTTRGNTTDINFIPSSDSLSLGGQNRPALIPTTGTVTNLGHPTARWNQVYASNLVGNADTATLAITATNIAAGAAGSIPYQISSGETRLLPAGVAGTVLTAGAAGTLSWLAIGQEALSGGTYLSFTNTSSGSPVSSYSLSTPTTISINATPANNASAVVARDSSGNFSASTVSANLSLPANGVISWPNDQYGGSGDVARIETYSGGGEALRLRLYVNDDPNDIIELDAAGGVLVTRGNITASAAPTSGSHIANKTYVDAAIADAKYHDIFSNGVQSPGPQSFPERTIRGFSAYSSTDFPGAYFGGITVNGPGNVYSGQLAFNWNSEESAPAGLYFRVNDDTSNTAAWSPWSQISTTGNDFVFIYGSSYTTSGFTNQVGSFNFSSNYFDVFPPGGKTMANLVAFIPSINIIYFAGGVNGDDSMICTFNRFGDRIRVYVQNTEQRSTPAANYLAIWR